MKTIIGGSREITDLDLISSLIDQVDRTYPITTVLCGGARGVDNAGMLWAKENEIPISWHLPDWRLGKQAGMLRNCEMVDLADFYISIWDGFSSGTSQCITYAESKKIGVFLFIVHQDGSVSYELLSR